MNLLLENIDKVHTTPMGINRISKNLELETDVVKWCKDAIINEKAIINRIGKNYYIDYNKCRITVNAYSYTIITAHKIKER